jgi:hypothetical protein
MSRAGEPRGPKWSPREIVRLRGYAARGFSAREAGILVGRSTAAVQMISGRVGITWHGPMGAPKMNRNRKLGEWRKELRRITTGSEGSIGASAATREPASAARWR